jgi:putative ABC transport system permease protein
VNPSPVPQPPRLAEWLLSLTLPESDSDSIIGDLCEELEAYVSEGGTWPRLWFWGQATLFSGRFLVETARGVGRSKTIGHQAASAAYKYSAGPDGRGLMMEGWIRDTKLAVRSLAKRPGFASLAIVTLALGIGANTAIFSVIHGSLLRPLPYATPDRLVWTSDTHTSFTGGGGADQSLPNLLDLRAASTLMESAAIYTFASANLATADRPERVRVLFTTSEMLGVLGVPPRLGRDLLPGDEVFGVPPVAILTDELWRNRFGADPGVIGQTTMIDSAPVEIVGVAAPSFTFPYNRQLILPLQHVGQDPSRGNRNYHAVGRLAPGAEMDGLQDELSAIFAGLVETYPGPNENWSTLVEPLRDWAVGRNQQSFFLLAGAVTLVLLIACVNVANLLLVRAETRQRELAVRYAMGAGRSGLIPHFLSEGLVLSLLGGILGCGVAYLGVDLLVAMYGNSLRRADQISLNTTALAFALGVSLLVGIVVGLVPLVRTQPDRLHHHLKEGSRGSSSRGSRLRQGLVIVEIALAVLIVAGAGLMMNSMWRLQQLDLGLTDMDRVMTLQISLPEAKYEGDETVGAFYDELVGGLERIPGVEAAAIVNRLPLMGGYNITNLPSVDDPERVAHFVEVRGITPGFFDATGIPLREGRLLDRSDFVEEPTAILINEELGRILFPGESPLGRNVNPGWTDGGFFVMGVVGDIHDMDVGRPPAPTLYYPTTLGPDRAMSVLVKAAGDPRSLLPAIRQSVEAIDREIPIHSVQTLQEIALSRLGTRRFAMSLFGVFAGLALLLGAVGIYGVMSFSVAQRSREMGVRVALGAPRASVMRLVLKEGARLTLPGVALGVGAALVSGRLLSGMLYDVSPLDPMTYVAVASLLTLVAMCATYIPARKATRVDPIASIRNE